MANQSLSTIQPSFEGILQQLQAYVNTKESWLSLSKSSTAELLLEAIAMVGEYDQYSIGAAVAETTFDNAHLPESIYTNSRFLSVRLTRKTPAHCTVKLQNTDLSSSFIEIPELSVFDINGTKYFNRNRLVFNPSTTIQNVELYEGEVKTATFTSNGNVYQTYELEERTPWSISNEDIICDVSGVKFTRSTDPVFQFKESDTKFYENSLPNGNVECKFGNDTFGQVPKAGSVITFKYAVTKGKDGNNTLTELQVKCKTVSPIIGETVTNAYGGSDEKPVDYYQQLGAQSGASNDRGITREDFKPLVLKYPGVIDCQVYGQAEIAPNDKRWMNVVALLLLTEDNFDNNSFKGLVKYLKNKSIYGFQFKWYKAQPVNIDINVKLYLKDGANLTKCRNTIITALQQYTALQLGSLGRSLYGSDIENIILTTLPNDIDYLDKKVPLIDYVIDKNQYIKVNEINVEAYYSERDTQYWVNPIDPYNYRE